jgi:O-antigen ligase
MGLRSFCDNNYIQKAFFVGGSIGGISAALFSAKGILIDHVGRVGLPLTNPIPYGQIAAILAIISLASFFQFRSLSALRTLSVLGFLGAVFAVCASGSAGALLGLFVGISIQVLILCRLSIPKPMLYGGLILFVIFLLMTFPLAHLRFERALAELSPESNSEAMTTSVGARFLLWKIAIHQIISSPWLGIGPGHFDSVMDAFCIKNSCIESFKGFHGVHNQYLDSFMNGGIFAILGLMLSFVGPVLLFGQRALGLVVGSPIAATAGLAVVLAAMVSNITQVFYGHNITVISYFFTLAFAWFLSASAPTSSDEEREF